MHCLAELKLNWLIEERRTTVNGMKRVRNVAFQLQRVSLNKIRKIKPLRCANNNKIKKKIGLIDHAWYMSPGSLTSLTCFMAQ